MRIGITERGDPSIDFSWVNKMGSVDGLVLITKNLTDKVIECCKPYLNKIIFHVTCTGYGGTIVELNIPRFEHQLEQAMKLVELGVDINRIVIRVDPIIPTEKGLKRVRLVFEKAIEMGFIRFRISIMDCYPHVKERFLENGLPLPYGSFFSASDKMFRDASNLLIDIRYDNPKIIIESCAESKLRGVEPIGCISKKDFELLGLNVKEVDSVGYQRKGCLCCSAKTELLSDKKQCPYKCLYCYWK